jgi:RNA polymerase primary sigma factor
LEYRFVIAHPRSDEPKTVHDPLRAYLEAISRVPLLSAEEEAQLTARLDVLRRSLRRRILRCGVALPHVFALFERVAAGRMRIDELFEVCTRDHLAKEQIRQSMPQIIDQLRCLLCRRRRSLTAARKADRPADQRARLLARARRLRREAVAVVEQFPVRYSHLDGVLGRMEEMAESPAGCRKVTAIRELKERYLASRNRLVSSSLRLAVAEAKRYRNRGVPFLDLIQEGNRGLIRAAEGYDRRRGARFATYAMWWIGQAVRRFVLEQSGVIRVPEYARLRAAAQTGIQLRVPRWTFSLDEPHADGENRLAEILPGRSEDDLLDSLDLNLLRERMARTLECLSDREREIILLRYGVIDQHGHTQAEVGRLVRMTRERVRQIETLAIKKMRQSAGRTQLRSFLDEPQPHGPAPAPRESRSA